MVKNHSMIGAVVNSYIEGVSWQRSFYRSRLNEVKGFFDSHCQNRVGAGECNFWSTNWLGTGPLLLHNLELIHLDLTMNQAYGNQF